MPIPQLFINRGREVVTAGAALCLLSACAPGFEPDVASAGPAGVAAPAGDDEPIAEVTTTIDAGGPNRAIVAIGAQRYVTDLDNQLSICITSDGGVSAIGSLDGFSDGSVRIELPPEEWETLDQRWDPPSIWLQLGVDADGLPIELHAGGDDVADHPELAAVSRVDSFAIDGVGATGTATFVDSEQIAGFENGRGGEVRTLTADFAVECD